MERVDTHIAHVFLAGDRAYKLKRAVKLPFLDFSTLARREAACRNEMRLNRRTAPSYYLDLVPVTRCGDGWVRLGGDGQVVDWVIEMRRFPDDALLDVQARQGGIDTRLINVLADEIAEFHADAEVFDDWGGAAEIGRTTRDNIERIASFVPVVFDGAKTSRLRELTLAEADRLASLLDRRRRQGKVRHCHGDLHLHNIFLDDGVPTLFDAIEFDDRLARIDVLYDLSFLVMDLWHRDLRWAANRILSRYLLHTADFEGLAAMPLFLALRAGIRAHVTAMMAEDADDPVPLREEARQYLDLALDVLQRRPAMLVGIGGFSGSGKSTVAAVLAPQLGRPPGAVCLRSDEIRKHFWGVSPEQELPEAAYAEDVSRRVYEEMRCRAAATVDAGSAAIADAVHNRRAARDELRAVAERAGVSFSGFWLEADEALLLRRVGGRTDDASDADADVVRSQLAGGREDGDWVCISADQTPENAAEEMLERIRRKQAAGTTPESC